MTTLRTATIIGYFSLPSADLAESNPEAYRLAMQGAPAGAGTCSQCGMGIRHHVEILDGTGARRFVGEDCATRIGLDAAQIRYHLTDEQKAAREARHEAERERQRQIDEAHRQTIERRRQNLADILDLLRAHPADFYHSLADQLTVAPLTERQSLFVAKLSSPTGRRNKQNAAEWDSIIERCTQWDIDPANAQQWAAPATIADLPADALHNPDDFQLPSIELLKESNSMTPVLAIDRFIEGMAQIADQIDMDIHRLAKRSIRLEMRDRFTPDDLNSAIDAAGQALKMIGDAIEYASFAKRQFQTGMDDPDAGRLTETPTTNYQEERRSCNSQSH